MRRLNIWSLVLFLLSIEMTGLSQTKTANIDTSLNKKSAKDSLLINSLKIEKLSDIFLAPLLYDFNPETPIDIRRQSLKLYLLNKNYERHIEELKYGRFYHLQGRTAEYLFLVQQKDDLYKGLKSLHKEDSPELKFIRKYLGVSKDIAALILMIINLYRY